MDKYVGGDSLHLCLLSGSMSNAPAASWEDHRVIRNNKQSAMSQILSLEHFLFLSFFVFLHLPLRTYTCNATTYTVSYIQHARLFLSFSLHVHRFACPYITSSRWQDNLHQFELTTKSPHHHNLITDSPSKNPVGVFRATASARRWKLERPSSPLLAHMSTIQDSSHLWLVIARNFISSCSW